MSVFSHLNYGSHFFILQVEFNKAAQSLSEALLPTTKKAALSRLLKVCQCFDLLGATVCMNARWYLSF